MNMNFYVHLYVQHNSRLLHLPPLRFHCVGGCWENPGLLRHWNWQPVALTTRLDLVHYTYKEKIQKSPVKEFSTCKYMC